MGYLILFLGQGFNYLLATVNIRAVSKGLISWTFMTDVLISLVQFTLIRKIAEAGDWYEALAYAAGGGVGSVVAIHLTRKWDRPQPSKEL